MLKNIRTTLSLCKLAYSFNTKVKGTYLRNSRHFLYQNTLLIKYRYSVSPNKVGNDSTEISNIKAKLKEAQKSYGQSDQKTLQLLHELTMAYKNQGNMIEATECYQNIVKGYRQNVSSQKSPEFADCLQNMASLYKMSGQLAKSIPVLIELIEIRQLQYGEAHQHVAGVWNQLGLSYYHTGNFSESIQNYEKCKKIRLELNGEESIQYINIMSNIASSLFKLGKLQEAKQIFQKNIRFLEKIQNKDGTESEILCKSNLATIYESERKLPESLKLFQEVEKLIQKYKPQSPFLCNIQRNIGILLLRLGDPIRAQKYHAQAMKRNINFFTQESPHVAINYHDMGTCYEMQGKLDQAITAYTKSLQLKKKTLGQRHFLLIETYNSLGIAYRYKNKYPQSRHYQQKSLQLLKIIHPDETSNPLFGEIYSNIGVTYLQEKNPKCEEYFNKSMNIFLKLLPEDDAKFIQLFFDLSRCNFQFHKNFSKARQYVSKSIKIQQKYTPDHPQLYVKYSLEASCYFELKQHENALSSYQKAIDLIEKAQQNQKTAINKEFLKYQTGLTLQRLKRTKEAQVYLEKSKEFFQSRFGQISQVLCTLYFTLSNVYQCNGNPEKAKQYLKLSEESVNQAIKKDPNNPEFKQLLVQIKKKLHD